MVQMLETRKFIEAMNVMFNEKILSGLKQELMDEIDCFSLMDLAPIEKQVEVI